MTTHTYKIENGARTMKISQKQLEAIFVEHANREEELKAEAETEVNRKAAEFHRGYAIAIRDILNGLYTE